MEIDSKVSSKVSTRSSKKEKMDKILPVQNNASDDISMSQLELLANKKKLNKKSEEFSIDLEKKSTKSEKSQDKHVLLKEKSSSRRKSSTISSSDSSDRKRDKRKINKENKNETIRKEKNDLLFKLYTTIEKTGGRWSSKMTMDNSLDEIRGEFTRIKATLDNESMVKFCKHGLVMGIKGVEMLNNSYDPLGVDLDGWGEAMSYNMSTTEYDEVLAELCDKYKGAGSMSPEVKLLVMIVMSGAMFSFSKKAAKDPSTLSNIMSSFMNKPKPASNEQSHESLHQRQQEQLRQENHQEQLRMQQQMQNQQNQQMQQRMQNQEQLKMQQMLQMQNQNKFVKPLDEQSDDSDNVPSKLRGPVFDTPDSINIENIIKTMKQKTKEKETKKSEIDIDKILNGTDTDEEHRDIPAPKQRGKGRQPKKTKVIKG